MVNCECRIKNGEWDERPGGPFCILDSPFCIPAKRAIALGRTRTCNPLVRSQVLYPIELRARYTPSRRDGSTELGIGHYSVARSAVEACVAKHEYGAYGTYTYSRWVSREVEA